MSEVLPSVCCLHTAVTLNNEEIWLLLQGSTWMRCDPRLRPSIRGKSVWTIGMQTLANWGMLINQESKARSSVLASSGQWRKQAQSICCTRSLPSFDVGLIPATWSLDVAACKASSKDLNDALPVSWAGGVFWEQPAQQTDCKTVMLQAHLPKMPAFNRMSFQALLNIIVMGWIYITSTLSVPVVWVICFLSGLKNIALKCLRSADYFSVFLCHRNSSALVGKTALVLSAETCFYNQQGSCVVLAGLCEARSGEDTVRGSGEHWPGHRWGRVTHCWCSLQGQWSVRDLGLSLPRGLLRACPSSISSTVLNCSCCLR